MRFIDIGGSLYNGMWGYGGRFPPVVIEELAKGTAAFPTYNYSISMALHSSTYLETSAHLYPDRINLDQLPLERCFLEAVVLHIPLGPHEHITAEAIKRTLAEVGESLRPRDGLIVNTGWYHRWDRPEYPLDPPHFTSEAIHWLLEQEISLLGSDSTRFDGRLDPQNHLAAFFEKDTLMLACLVNLDQVQRARVKLIVLPLKVASCCAPCRAIVWEDFHGDWLDP